MDNQERRAIRPRALPESDSRHLLERVETLLWFALPLVCWPNLERPFSTPKLWLLSGIALLAAIRIPGLLKSGELEPKNHWPAAVWMAAVSVSALLCAQALLWPLAMALLTVVPFWTGARGPQRLATILKTLWAATLVESVIALLQFSYHDPMRLFGWVAESFPAARMRVYGTLGNPDFVAAWICALLPAGYIWTLDAERGAHLRWGRAAGLLLAVAAMAATGSRIVWLALPLQFIVFCCARKPLAQMRRMLWAPALAVALLLALLPWRSPVRSLRTTMAGRQYLAQITLSGWRSIPLTGFGPGAYADQFARWQDRWAAQNPKAAAAASQFAGLTEHAHNDPLEFFVEYGWTGAAVQTAISLWAIWRLWDGLESAASLWWWAAAAGLVTLAGMAMVDFPLHRPAEASLFWLYLGALKADGRPARTSSIS